MRNELRRTVSLIGVALLVIGGGILVYPKFTAWQYAKGADEQKEEFSHQVHQVEEESQEDPVLEELFQRLEAENRKLFEEHQPRLTDPFSYEAEDLDLSEYGLEDGIIGFFSSEKMGVELPIYLGASQENLALGAAHMTQTSYPIGGINTNCVLAGHRGYYKAPMFRNIDRLEVGDVVEVRNFREELRYQVSEIAVVEPDQVECLYIRPGEDLLTLISCHPYPTNTYRYVVTCTRVA